jgi:hypothetical protein
MSYFVVEHVYKGYPMFETITGVEDINIDMYPGFQSLWVCDNTEEVTAVENELRKKYAERSSKQA